MNPMRSGHYQMIDDVIYDSSIIILLLSNFADVFILDSSLTLIIDNNGVGGQYQRYWHINVDRLSQHRYFNLSSSLTSLSNVNAV